MKKAISIIMTLVIILAGMTLPSGIVKAAINGKYCGYDTYADYVETMALAVEWRELKRVSINDKIEYKGYFDENWNPLYVTYAEHAAKLGYVIPDDCVEVLYDRVGNLFYIGYRADGSKFVIVKVDGYDVEGYDQDGYDRNGYNVYGYNHDGYDVEGYDQDGYDKDGYNQLGYNKNGYDKDGYDYNGYNRDGYDKSGYDRFGYDRNGYDREGYNIEGYNRYGYDRNGKKEEEEKPIVGKYIDINKKNFGDLAKTLLKEEYDIDQDKKLSQFEVKIIRDITVTNKVQDIRGLSYLPHCEWLRLENFIGKKYTIKDKNIKYVCVFSKNDLTVIAPNAEGVLCDGKNTKINAPKANYVGCYGVESIDISQCNKARIVSVTPGTKIKNMKLPQNADAMRSFEMWGPYINGSFKQAGISTLNLSKYKNLLKVEFLHCGFKKVNMNECTKIKYLYMFDCDSIESIDMRGFKKFTAGDFFGCKKLQNIKTPLSGKVTKGKGCWWIDSKYYEWEKKNKIDMYLNFI